MLGEKEKQNLATAPGKLWMVGGGRRRQTHQPGQDVKTTLSEGCHRRNHHLWALVAGSDISWGKKEKRMFLMKHGYRATAPGPMAGAATKTLHWMPGKDKGVGNSQE